MSTTTPAGVEILAPVTPEFDEILTPGALELLTKLVRALEPRRRELLAHRIERQRQLDAGKRPDFLPETADVRAGDWVCAPVPADLQDRRVEITGPVDRKMIINALNSGAKVFMSDFEDSNTPDLGEHHPGPGQPARRRAPARSSSATRTASATRSTTRRPRCWCAPGAGT